MAQPVVHVRTATTLVVLALVLVIGGAWGWSALTEPFPGRAEAPACSLRPVAPGDKVYPEEVTVSVLNAGSREGLAGQTMQLLEDEGFDQGDSGNAPSGTHIETVEIWTDDPQSPAVRLVASRLGDTVGIVNRDATAAGVVVVVGDGFSSLSKGRGSMVALEDGAICSPSIG